MPIYLSQVCKNHNSSLIFGPLMGQSQTKNNKKYLFLDSWLISMTKMGFHSRTRTEMSVPIWRFEPGLFSSPDYPKDAGTKQKQCLTIVWKNWLDLWIVQDIWLVYPGQKHLKTDQNSSRTKWFIHGLFLKWPICNFPILGHMENKDLLVKYEFFPIMLQ